MHAYLNGPPLPPTHTWLLRKLSNKAMQLLKCPPPVLQCPPSPPPAAEKELSNKAIDPSGLTTPLGGTNSTIRDLTAIGEGRGTVLELKLDRMADSVRGGGGGGAGRAGGTEAD